MIATALRRCRNWYLKQRSAIPTRVGRLRLDLENRAAAIGAARVCRTVEIASSIADHAGIGYLAVRAVAEAVQHGLGPGPATCRRELEHRATTRGLGSAAEPETYGCPCAAQLVRPVKIARGIKNPAGVRRIAGRVNVEAV